MRSLGKRRKYRTAKSVSIGRIDQWNGVIKTWILMRCNNTNYCTFWEGHTVYNNCNQYNIPYVTRSREMSHLSKILFSCTTFSRRQNASFWFKPHYNWISGYRVMKAIWNKGIWTLFWPISQKQHPWHPTHFSWSCHICCHQLISYFKIWWTFRGIQYPHKIGKSWEIWLIIYRTYIWIRFDNYLPEEWKWGSFSHHKCTSSKHHVNLFATYGMGSWVVMPVFFKTVCDV